MQHPNLDASPRESGRALSAWKKAKSRWIRSKPIDFAEITASWSRESGFPDLDDSAQGGETRQVDRISI